MTEAQPPVDYATARDSIPVQGLKKKVLREKQSANREKARCR